jgi:hypothetical protein
VILVKGNALRNINLRGGKTGKEEKLKGGEKRRNEET